MIGEIVGTILIFLLTLLLAYPLGKYIVKVFKGEKTFTDFMNPMERFIFRISGINPNESMNWKQFLRAMLTVNMLWLVYAMLLLIFQDKLPLNPDGNSGQTPDLLLILPLVF
jgi:K+-transporting ATPase ATPase A chain